VFLLERFLALALVINKLGCAVDVCGVWFFESGSNPVLCFGNFQSESDPATA